MYPASAPRVHQSFRQNQGGLRQYPTYRLSIRGIKSSTSLPRRRGIVETRRCGPQEVATQDCICFEPAAANQVLTGGLDYGWF